MGLREDEDHFPWDVCRGSTGLEHDKRMRPLKAKQQKVPLFESTGLYFEEDTRKLRGAKRQFCQQSAAGEQLLQESPSTELSQEQVGEGEPELGYRPVGFWYYPRGFTRVSLLFGQNPRFCAWG